MEHSVDSILGAMRELLDEHGHEKLSYRQIADRAGISVGTVAYYFGSRSELYEAALDEHHKRIANIVGSLVAVPDRGHRTLLGEVVAELTRYSFENRARTRLRVVAWVASWGLPKQRRSTVRRIVDRVTQLNWSPQWNTIERRIIVQALSYAAQRFAAMSEADLIELIGVDSADDAHTQVAQTFRKLSESFLLDDAQEPDSPA